MRVSFAPCSRRNPPRPFVPAGITLAPSMNAAVGRGMRTPRVSIQTSNSASEIFSRYPSRSTAPPSFRSTRSRISSATSSLSSSGRASAYRPSWNSANPASLSAFGSSTGVGAGDSAKLSRDDG